MKLLAMIGAITGLINILIGVALLLDGNINDGLLFIILGVCLGIYYKDSK
jgi:hypothetical protein